MTAPGLQLNFDKPGLREILPSAPIFRDTAFSTADFKIEYLPMTTAQRDALERRHTKVKRGQERTNENAFRIDFLIRSITGWEGIADANGAAQECNAETIAKMLDLNPMFAKALYTAIMSNELGVIDDEEEDADAILDTGEAPEPRKPETPAEAEAKNSPGPGSGD